MGRPGWMCPAITASPMPCTTGPQAYIDGFMTVRKETRQRGGAYWSAYRRRNGKLRKIYIGQSAALTQDKLEAVAMRLRDPPVSLANVTQQSRISMRKPEPTAINSTSSNGHF